MEAGNRILLEEFAVDRRRTRPGIDQPGSDAEGFPRGGGKAEAAGIGGEPGVERRGNRLGERHLQPQAHFRHDSGGRLGGGILEPAIGEIVFADVVIDHHHAAAQLFHHIGHRPQLRPGAGVEHNHQIAVEQIGLLHPFCQRFDPFVGIDPGKRGRRGLGIDDAHMLAEGLEDAEHSQLAAQRVAIGAHMAGEHHPLGLLQHLHQTQPIKSHACSSASVSKKEPEVNGALNRWLPARRPAPRRRPAGP